MMKLTLSEGRLAWSLVFSTFMLNVLRTCFTGNYGQILNSIKETFQVNNAEASLANSLLAFLSLGLSPVSAWLTPRLGHRLTIILGATLASAGLLTAGLYIDFTEQPPNILFLYLSIRRLLLSSPSCCSFSYSTWRLLGMFRQETIDFFTLS